MGEGEAGEGLGEGVQGGPERRICWAFGELAVKEGARVQWGGKALKDGLGMGVGACMGSAHGGKGGVEGVLELGAERC